MMATTLSIDLDDRWTYLKTRGDKSWESFPTYLPLIVPRVLEFFRQESRAATWFLVGQDAALERNRELLRSITDAGHEVGNHSFHHNPWLHRYGRNELEAEIVQAEQAIEAATGCRPKGFRGPGFTQSDDGLEVLTRRGYHYDASPCANSLGPLARLWYFRGVSLTEEQRRERSQLAGNWREAFGENKPYHVRQGAIEILRIPVTTFPGVHIPIHFSYLNMLPPIAAKAYYRAALAACEATQTPISLLLHPTDFLGLEDNHGIPFFPGLDRPVSAKLEGLRELLRLTPQSSALGEACGKCA